MTMISGCIMLGSVDTPRTSTANTMTQTIMSKTTAPKTTVPQALLAFTEAALAKHTAIKTPAELSLSPLSGDAGFRQYFRVNTQPPLLAVQAPLEAGISESAVYFARLSEQLINLGVPCPQVLAVDAEQNLMLIEDMGEHLLLDELNTDTAGLLYGEALMVLSRLQQIPRHKIDVAEYGRAELEEELNVFSTWFVKAMLVHTPSHSQTQTIQQTFEFLTQQALAQPQTLVHRDYHSRNLIYREGEAPGVIDFQDAVWGPITYDLVSLLRDCYIRWPEDKVEQWLMSYGELLIELDLIPAIEPTQWQKWFDLMGLQRHIKVLGVFARLYLRDNKPGYLDDLPLVLRYTIEIAEKYPETQGFAKLLSRDLMPLIEKQSWYRDYRKAGEQ